MKCLNCGSKNVEQDRLFVCCKDCDRVFLLEEVENARIRSTRHIPGERINKY